MSGKYLDETGLTYLWSKLRAYFQVKLVSGTNIKTVGGQSLLGSGDIQVAIDEYILSSSHSTGSFSVSANAAVYKDVTISPPQAGYVPLAVVNIVCNASAAIPTGWLFQNSTTVRIYVRNVTSSAVTQTVTFIVLWKSAA